jgi:hypothetical protein
MKVRSGFVSNSSSLSHVIAVTRNIKITEDHAIKFIKECQMFDEEENIPKTIDEAITAMRVVVEYLCSEGEVSYSDTFDPEVPFLMEFMEVFPEIVISETDGSLGSSFITNILADKFKEKTLQIVNKKYE